jgi:hypothetical protein
MKLRVGMLCELHTMLHGSKLCALNLSVPCNALGNVERPAVVEHILSIFQSEVLQNHVTLLRLSGPRPLESAVDNFLSKLLELGNVHME